MFERDQKILIQFLLFSAGLVLESLALLDRIILLGISRRDLLAIDAAFENFDSRRIVG